MSRQPREPRFGHTSSIHSLKRHPFTEVLEQVFELQLRRLDGLSQISGQDWNRLDTGDSPFLSHEFLHGLEIHGCLRDHGWYPAHLAAFAGETLVGAAPMYLKTNSYGEFVFDWSWADAYERAGGKYYPKLVSAIPFTPVGGPRLLVATAEPSQVRDIRRFLLNGILDQARKLGVSSWHCLFPEAAEAGTMTDHGLLRRKGIQFHWFNRGYRDFNDFLDSLSSKKRKQIRRERRSIPAQGIEIQCLEGAEISCAQWDCFYDLYCSTFHRRWGSPRFTRDFFYSLSEVLPRQTLLVMANQGGTPVAGAFAMRGNTRLYGRHWGCFGNYDNLHFELCYYQTIDYCIRNGLQCVDAGVQGEHKLSRGFEPVMMDSWHWIEHPGLRKAIADFLAGETRGVEAYLDELNRHLPYKSGTGMHPGQQQT